MEEQPVFNNTPTEPEGSTKGIAAHIQGDYVEFGPGIALAVEARQDAAFSKGVAGAIQVGHDMVFSKGSACVAAVGRDLTLNQGGNGIMAVGRNANISQGGAWMINAGGGAQFDQGGAGLVVSPTVSASRSRFGMVIASQVNLSEDSRVMFSTVQALAFGAAFGAFFGLIAWLFRRR